MTEILVNGKWPLRVPEHKINQEWWDVWEKERLQSMFETIKAGDVVFDIGAEEGDFSALFARWAGDKGRVVLVEPSKRMWPCIRGIWEANGLEAPAGAYRAFCGRMDNRAIETDDEGRGFWPACSRGEIVPDPGFNNMIEHPEMGVVTIDELAFQFRTPNVVTIDVEGAEFEVMKGAKETLAKMKTVFFISIHPEFMANDYPYTSDDLLRFMDEAGYVAELLAIDHEHHYKFTPGQ